MRKRLISVLLSVAMIVSMLPAVVSAAFSDIQGHWAQAEIQRWSEKGIIQGYGGLFRPNEPVTRGEMAVMLDRIMKYQEKADNSFNDLDQSWYTDALLKANAAGIIVGNNGNVRPKDNITREEAVVMLGRALRVGTDKADRNTGFKDNDQISGWAAEYVWALHERGYVNGDPNGNFNPKDDITRAEVVKILDNSIKALYAAEGEYSDKVIDGTVIISAPSVVLKNMEIKGDLIIAEGVGDGDVTLDNVKISGNTIVKGGGVNSVYFNSVTVGGALVVNKVGGNIRIVASGTTSVSVATLESGAILITKELIGGGIEKVVIPESIAKGQNIVLQGNFNSVENNAPDISIEAKGKIENLVLNAKTVITGEVEIKTVSTAEGADSVINGKTVSGGQSNVELTDPENENNSSDNDSNNGSNNGDNGGNNGSDNGNNNNYICLVTFDTNGGSVIPAVNVSKGQRLTLPEEPVKDGVDFIGWYLDAELTQQFDPSMPITSDITLYAKWSGWQEPVKVDSRFAEGYPKASFNTSLLEIDIKMKLKGASDENPMEVFIVVTQGNAHLDFIETNSVIHGHAGKGDDLLHAEKSPYIIIKDENEHVISVDGYFSEDESAKIYFVIKDASKTSAVPTLLEYAIKKTTTVGTDRWAPFFEKAYINKAGDKITLYFSEKLDTGSIPQPEDFTLSGASVTSVVYNVYSVERINIYNNDKWRVGRVELDLSNPIDDATDLRISYTGTALRDCATVPNAAWPIFEQPVHTAALSISDVDVSHNGQYILMNINNWLNVEEGKSFNIRLKYGTDFSTAYPLAAGSYYIDYNDFYIHGRKMAIKLKLINEPVLTEGYKYFITFDAYGLKDLAGDDIPLLTAVGVPRATPESEIIPEVIYDPDVKEILLTFSEGSNLEDRSFSACFFILTVGGREYNLRGYVHYSTYSKAIRLTQDNIPMDMDSVDWQNAKISYTLAVHPGADVWDYLTFTNGMPYQGFTHVPITVQP
jgi:uncharacterized repeat protein (TIGR02543 family)